MSHTHLSPSTSRRDLAASLRGSRTRKQTRLRHRRLQAEHLEDRRLLATISGQVFNDLNANGLKDTAESGQSGWTVYLDADGNGQLDTGETSATTAADGSYSIDGLAAGTYSVTEVQQLGWQQTSPVGTAPAIERVSVADDGAEGNGSSDNPRSLSADGRYVAFSSSASNLVPDDTNGKSDIFVVDRLTNTTELVSRAFDGAQGNDASTQPSISADGRYISFASYASNLVPGDTNATCDIFVVDRQTPHTIGRVSIANNGTQANGPCNSPSISADGRTVAFYSSASSLVPGDTNGTIDVFVYDRQTDTIERVSLAADGTQANGYSDYPSISADGRYVAFNSTASNLVPGDTNAQQDVFVYDRQTDSVQRVSLAADGTQGNSSSNIPKLSADGRYVAFKSIASNLVSGDTNGVSDVFVTANPFAPVPGSHVVALADGQDVAEIDFGNMSLDTKFYVVNDATLDRTYEYNATGTSVETYSLNTGNTAPRGAASTIAGDKTWVVDANRKVYIYNNSGSLLGSWTAGTLSTKAVVEGIATNGTDIWIVDAYSDKVYKYAGAAAHLSGTWTATSFSLNRANKSPKDIVTNGVNLWVVNDSIPDKVFKYTTAGALVSSWTITTAGATSPTGITIDPANVSNIWIVDNGTDRVYQYNTAATFANGSSHAADVAFALAVGNTNPQGIADPPAPSSLLTTGTAVLAESVSAEAALRGNNAALENLYDEPLRMGRIDIAQRSESRTAESHTRDLSYIVGASALAEPVAQLVAHHSANDRKGITESSIALPNTA